METIVNQAFQEEAVTVDGKEFTRCVFEDVRLVYAGGELPTFISCQFIDVSLQFEDTAANTIRFLSGLPGHGFPAALENIIRGIRSR